MVAPTRSPVPRVLAALATLPVVVLGIGFVFHTSLDPTVLGKYSLRYAVFLAAWWVVVTPATILLALFVFRTQRIELESGRVLHLRPSAKILTLLVLGLLLVWGGRRVVHRRLGRGVATPQRSDVFHPFLQNTPEPGRRRFGVNRWGFRGREIERGKPEGAVRIFALGGSTVFSGPLPLAQTWPELLAERLRADDSNVAIEVQNAASEWHCTQHSLIKMLTRLPDFAPDLVIVYHAVNDLGRSFVPDLFGHGPYRDDYGHYWGPVARLADPSRTWPMVRMSLGYWFSDVFSEQVRIFGPTGDGVGGLRRVFLPKARRVEIDAWPSLRPFRRNLAHLIRATRAEGCEIMLATQPHLYRSDLTPEERQRLWTPIVHQQDGTCPTLAAMVRGMDLFNGASREIAEEHGVPIVDLEAAVPKTTSYLYDDVHTTAAGCERIADAIHRAMVVGDVIRRIREEQRR